MRNIPTGLLQTFATVVELGGVTRAANALGRSQSAARLQMRSLASFVGVPLCQWDGRRKVPTDSGGGTVERVRRHRHDNIGCGRWLADQTTVLACQWRHAPLARQATNAALRRRAAAAG